ncbi:MAG TPA: type II secretion system F family protein [Dehalococcoidia bacterium]
MLLLFGSIIVFAAIASLVYGLVARPENQMSARLAGLRGERSELGYAESIQRESLAARVFLPMADSLALKLEHLLPTRFIAGIENRLIQAGQPVTLAGFLIGSVVVEAVLLTLGFTLVTSAGGGRSWLLMGALAGFGIIMPKIWLDNRARHRQKEILKSLPDAFDLVTVCVEAGLGLEAALARVAEKQEGAFGEEIALTMREISLGKLRRDALKELATRIGVPDLTTFVNAVIQAESMGTSIATVLRVQADQMRTRRRQRAEQQAHQAPIKMMFPLVLFIFPSLFIVILGPAGISIYRTLVEK